MAATDFDAGSIVFVKEVDPTTLQVGDPITFYLNGNVIATHRIIQVQGAGTSQLGFRTQGDANDHADGVTPASAVIGKVAFTIPYLGYLSNFIQQPQGVICVIGVGAGVMLLSYMIDWIFEKSKKSESEADPEANNG